jgi:hypothetical protein
MESIAGLPDHIVTLLSSEDARHGYPPGTMASIMQQEVGGQLEKYLGDPTAYHYAPDKRGIRRTQDGTVSNAFGPFGILDSTAREPGYGVAPLKDKASLDDQIRFAGDYLAARIGQAKSFEDGIASYGQGPQYAQSVVRRIPGYEPSPVNTASTQMANAEAAPPKPVATTVPAPVVADELAQLQQAQQPAARPEPAQVALSRFGGTQIAPPKFDPGLLQSLAALGGGGTRGFGPFRGLA